MKLSALPQYTVNTQTKIYGGFLGQRFCDQVIEAFDRLDKIDNTGLSQDNLFDTERTSWTAHHDDEVKNVCSQMFETFLTFGRLSCRNNEQMEIDLFESWIAKSNKDAFVEPHHHYQNLHGCSWSFVFYACIPSGQSELVFLGNEYEKKSILVRQGDFLIFPSDLPHYSEDTCEGRIILSGNFHVRIK